MYIYICTNMYICIYVYMYICMYTYSVYYHTLRWLRSRSSSCSGLRQQALHIYAYTHTHTHKHSSYNHLLRLHRSSSSSCNGLRQQALHGCSRQPRRKSCFFRDTSVFVTPIYTRTCGKSVADES